MVSKAFHASSPSFPSPLLLAQKTRDQIILTPTYPAHQCSSVRRTNLIRAEKQISLVNTSFYL